MRRLLVRILLGRKTYQTTQRALSQGLEEWGGCVTDPEMYKNADDLEVAKAVRRDMLRIDTFWFRNQNDKFYSDTKGLEDA